MNNAESEKEITHQSAPDVDLKEQLATAEKQILYLRSDLENIRKNTLREIQQRSQKNALKIIEVFLEVFDNFQRCIQSTQGSSENGLKEGLQLVHKSMIKSLTDLGVEEIPTQTFDPEVHEALSFAPASDKNPENSIVAVIRSGYLYQGKVVRPAQVIVAQEA